MIRKYTSIIFEKLGFKIQRVTKKEKLLLNVFNSQFEKKVLISYILNPFLDNNFSINHTNYFECKASAEIFNELGYQVDVVHFEDTNFKDFQHYDVVYGMGDPLENYFYSKKKNNSKSIHYGTGCNPYFSNTKSALRVYQFYRRTGVLAANSSRIIYKTRKLQTIFTDGIIALGNNFVKQTYLDEAPHIKCYNIDCFNLYENKIDLNKKNYETSKNQFIWFGSSGKIHKGLDIVIDLFLDRKDITLHIGCSLIGENEFWDYYLPKIKQVDNIILHGHIDVTSDKFKNILMQSGAVIYPSISEGGSPSVLTICANSGLFPIVSVNSGLDLEDFGFMIKEVTHKNFEHAIDQFLKLDTTFLKTNSKKLMEHTIMRYNYKNYYNSLKDVIIKIIE